ncbi:hypothetical protein CK203_112774 [Vitis vinifera]|uniref:Uncharacterized protein n=1 Tax=Vitis vinifera TaxID=29760 RepID=A0A438D916_VITVI|nr:hypothetical protein CK203_112774 [Vitis vinifera]
MIQRSEPRMKIRGVALSIVVFALWLLIFSQAAKTLDPYKVRITNSLFLGLIETQANGKFRRLFTSRLGSSLITLTS